MIRPSKGMRHSTAGSTGCDSCHTHSTATARRTVCPSKPCRCSGAMPKRSHARMINHCFRFDPVVCTHSWLFLVAPHRLLRPPDETCADYTGGCTYSWKGPALDDVVCTGPCDESTCCVWGKWYKHVNCFRDQACGHGRWGRGPRNRCWRESTG